ncbi:MAG: hypothetical protein GY838_00030 [bacterium]|nr:hypothetical protein [bacterium]
MRKIGMLIVVSAALLLLSGCGTEKIVFVYPDEALAFRYQSLGTPSLFLGEVTDLRPPSQRQGEGKFFRIRYPKDDAWEVPPTQIYAEALAQDVDQTQLFELVPLRGQADYALRAELLSMGCQLRRTAASLLLPTAIGAGAGMALGEEGADRVKLAAVLAVVSVMTIPVPTENRAEAEIRLTLEDNFGNVVWQRACLGEYEDDKFITATARQDQELVDEYLTKAVKRANACLLGQLRQFLLDGAAAES